MYSHDTIRKMISRMGEKKAELDARSADEIRLCISAGNQKIGRVLNVSLPPVLTCGNCSKCMYLCYDIKANLMRGSVLDARMRNLALLEKDGDAYFRRIEDKLSRRRKNKFFRWHVAGDIVDLDYFSRMVELAHRHPDFIFWTYTKMYHIVNAYIETNGAGSIPNNLHIMFSEWRGMSMNNPHGMPEFRVVFKDDEAKPQGYYCPGNCDICKASGRGCLAGETTYCMEH